MWIFSKSKRLTSDEYEKLWKEIIELRGNQTKFSLDIQHLETKQNSIRGILNKRFYKKLDGEDETTETINNKDFIPFTGLK